MTITSSDYMAVFERVARRWDSVMNEIDRWPDEALADHGDDARSLAAHLRILTDLARAAAGARDHLANRMADVVKKVPRDQRQIPNVGTLDVRGGATKHRYDAELMVGAAAKAVSQVDGEIRDQQAAIKAFAALAGCDTDGYSGWRKTVAETYGIDLNKYRTTEHGPLKAVLL